MTTTITKMRAALSLSKCLKFSGCSGSGARQMSVTRDDDNVKGLLLLTDNTIGLFRNIYIIVNRKKYIIVNKYICVYI